MTKVGPGIPSGPNNPFGPEFEPINGMYDNLPAIITIYDGKTEEIINEIEIDYGRLDHRKYLGRVTLWAMTKGHIVETKKAEVK